MRTLWDPRLVLLVAIAALIVGALGVVDLLKSEPSTDKFTAEVVEEKMKKACCRLDDLRNPWEKDVRSMRKVS